MLIFDKDFNLVDLAYEQLDEAYVQPVGNVNKLPMQLLSLSRPIKEPGYVYIYLSNEGSVQQDIYFDDLTITHQKSKVVQGDDYYPFGLTFNSYQRENSVDQKYLYNGKEIQNELDLGWYDHGARMYMADIGRWGVIDPLAEKFVAWSPYNFVYNNPVNFYDPTGESGIASIDEKNKTITVSSHLVFYGSKASDEQAKKTTAEIQKMYDGAGGKVTIDGVEYFC
jgi:RHS repeat-associated protein